ncbi:MAG: hypothetical protein ACRDL7_10955, partial [Gaiellaceae bacterium]
MILFNPSPGGPLYSVRASGGNPEAVTVVDTSKGETTHRWPCFLPDGEHFLYVALPAEKNGQYACYVGSLRSHDRTLVIHANGAAVYSAPHYLLYQRGEAVLAQRFDLGALKTSGDPFSVADLPSPTQFSGAACISVSNNGVLAWQSAGSPDTRVMWTDRSGHELHPLGIPQDRWSALFIAPDARHAILHQSLPTGDTDLWTVDLNTEIANRITFGQGVNSFGSFSSDSREFLYTSTRNGTYQIFRRATDGSGTDQAFPSPNAQFKYASSWSPDGRWAVLQVNGDQDGWNLVIQPAAGGAAIPYVVTPFDELNPQISPDGKWCLYSSNESGTSQVYIQSFPQPGHRRQVTKSGGVFGA